MFFGQKFRFNLGLKIVSSKFVRICEELIVTNHFASKVFHAICNLIGKGLQIDGNSFIHSIFT